MSEIHTRPITEPCAWSRADVAESDDWKHELTGAEIDDLDRALKGIGNPGGRLVDITREDFPLPVRNRLRRGVYPPWVTMAASQLLLPLNWRIRRFL